MHFSDPQNKTLVREEDAAAVRSSYRNLTKKWVKAVNFSKSRKSGEMTLKGR